MGINVGLLEILADLEILIRSVSAVIFAIAEIRFLDAEVIFALEPFSRAILALWVPRGAPKLVTEIVAVSASVTLAVHGNAVSRGALELVLWANIVLTANLIRPVATVIIMVTSPPRKIHLC